MAVSLQQLIDAQKTFDPVSYTLLNPETGKREVSWGNFTAPGYEGDTQATSLYVPESIAKQLAPDFQNKAWFEESSLIPGIKSLTGSRIAPARNTMGEESGLDTFMEDYAGPLAAAALTSGAMGGFGIPGAPPSGLGAMFKAATAGGTSLLDSIPGMTQAPAPIVDGVGIPNTAGVTVGSTAGPVGVGNAWQNLLNPTLPGLTATGASATDYGGFGDKVYDPDLLDRVGAAAPITSSIPTVNSFGDKLAQLGIPGAQALFGSAATGAAALSGAKGLASLFGGSTTGAYQFPWGDAIGSLLEFYGLKEQSDNLNKLFEKAIDYSDPFRAERPFYQKEFKNQYTDPNYFNESTVFKGLRDDALNTVERRLASQGYNMSGNMMQDLTKTATTEGYKYAMPFMDMTGKAAGAFQGPGKAGEIAANLGTQSANNIQNQWGALGAGAQSIGSGTQPSMLSQIFGGQQPNKTLGQLFGLA